MIHSKSQKFLPTKSFAHQDFTNEVFIFFIVLIVIAARKHTNELTSVDDRRNGSIDSDNVTVKMTVETSYASLY